ncbi:hypothetical protein METBIDRAFT_78917 [Metschnikowia bicuspidata var. bicuspidata NRRL YB-4993]|uniref:ubiquitinyl hydrolase 1 n=1 Tax=Metschnikowia bicuspidata var. bicuspidata NRRL YB-4993 TaxID=869754 RepID=A0A1A0H9A2_9ASCO|nr:hypothetical protein METBIDRAFT_78917 [Metschnikowia bicuspidata var. bicuspidata NRRL YB-4993]OBA20575.1 hypothetical protein METBIDRAFT_78917 [Metschnikowia bicuspidata var. bicuspidata NRRL YB-4993]
MDHRLSGDYSEDEAFRMHPESSGSEVYPHANEYEKLGRRMMKKLPDYPVKDSTHFVWEIQDWSAARKENKLVSPLFNCGGYYWNVLLFPRGNADAVSLYLEPHPPADDSEKLNSDWYVCAQFALDIWNPLHPSSHYPSGSSHRFNKNETDWGFSSFISSRDLADPLKVGQPHAILENNQINITAFVRVLDDTSTGVLWSNFVNYDSKLSTGFVGLNNQGATCYLNSLLQSYFTTKKFRNLVCQIPTQEQTTAKTSNKNSKAVALALQRIFYLMESSDQPVGTMELTRSFGWDSSEAFTQHDVQELNRVLMDKLESAMKGSHIENRLNDIFVGRMKSFIKCVNVPYESSRIEDFWDIQLNVKGLRNLLESFRNYIDIEMLDGENKYQAGEEYGYQDAKKGVVFESFPPVLHLQLKRFEYDFMVDDLVKIDDFYEFPDKIDLRPYLDEDLDEDVKSQNWNYKLHGVLVHQGSISNGHYYAMIKPESEKNTWLRFDDDKVWKVTPSEVFKENFGAADLSPQQVKSLSRMEQNEHLIRKATSAYMLVYYREGQLSDILPDSLATVPEHVSGQIEKEREELASLEKAKQDALYYLNVKMVTAENFAYFNGFDICPDPTKTKEYDNQIFDARAYPITMKVRKDAKFSHVYKLIAYKLGYVERFNEDAVGLDEDNASSMIEDEAMDNFAYPFSLMIMKQRNNKTIRPDIIIPKECLNETVSQVFTRYFRKSHDELTFFVRENQKEMRQIKNEDNFITAERFNFDNVSSKVTENVLNLTEASVDNSMTLFLKYFDPISDTLRGLTFVLLSKNMVLSLIKNLINEFLGFDVSTPLEFYEEVSRTRIEPIDQSLALEKSELGSGDILAIQLADRNDFQSACGLGSLQKYYKFMLTRLHIQVKPCKVSEEDEDSDYVADDGIFQSTENLNADSAEAKELKLARELSKSFDLWVSTTYTYEELAARIACNIGSHVDPKYLRLFVTHDHGERLPLLSTMSLSQIFPRQVAVSTVSQFEFEILNITLKEYENMKAIKIHWLESIYQDHVYDLLVPKTSPVSDLIQKLTQKIDLPQEKLSGLLVWTGKDHKYVDLVKFDRPIDDLKDDFEIYCGYFPAEVEILVCHDMFKRYAEPESHDGHEISDPIIRGEFEKAQKYSNVLNIIPVFHFHKSTTYTHGKPFVFAAFPDEPFEQTKERLRNKLGLGILAFEKIRIALADLDDKGRYLDVDKPGFNLLDEISKFESHVSLALDHRDRDPKRSNPLDKGISIG